MDFGLERWLESSSQSLAEATQVPVDSARYTFCLLLNIALGCLFVGLPSSANLRHVSSLVISGYFSWFLFGYTSFHMVGSSALVYLAMAVLPRSWSHHFIFVFAMSYISGCHIYRMYHDWMGWTLDFSGPQMILTLKLIMIGVNYAHGDPARAENGVKRLAPLSNLPTPLEFFGYCLCFPTFLAGPVIDYDTYIKFCNKENVGIDTASRLVATGARVLWFALSAGTFVYLSGMFPLEPTVTLEFSSKPLLYRMMYGYLASHAVAFKYYTGWFLSEAACVACGLGYNGEDSKGRHRWDKCSNARVLKIIFAQNVKGFTDNWNIGVAVFPKDYVYLRLSSSGVSQGMCTIVTQVLCAFWHGFYPSYFIMFLSLTGFVTVARGLRRGLRHYFVTVDADTGRETGLYPKKYFYDFMGFFLITVGVQYSMGMFQSLSLERCVIFCSNSGWSGHIAIVMLLLLCEVLPKKRKGSRSTPVKEVEMHHPPSTGGKVL